MSAADHAALMDGVYRYQRRIYDVTRRYYLLGRTQLIEELEPPAGGTVLELACGTGWNLDRIARRWPGRRLYGLDISSEMLTSARAKLGTRAVLAQGDATRFDAGALFGVERFDRVILSYAVSMIPDWEGALAAGAGALAPGGTLHVVDFGGQTGLPAWFGSGLRGWLARFHVTARADLAGALERAAAEIGGSAACAPLYRDYAVLGRVTARK